MGQKNGRRTTSFIGKEFHLQFIGGNMSDNFICFTCKSCDAIDIVLKDKAKEWVCPSCRLIEKIKEQNLIATKPDLL